MTNKVTERFNSFFYIESRDSNEFDAEDTIRVNEAISFLALEGMKSIKENSQSRLSVLMVLGSIFTAGLLPLILFLVALIQCVTETGEEFSTPDFQII